MIENTANNDPLLKLFDAMDIPAAEKRGQTQLVNSPTLPTQGDWEKAEALGVIRGEQVPGDELFTYATLPDGWEVRPTDHYMWSEVIDTRGIKVIGIGYKAAFYDRWASFHVVNVGYDVIADLLYPEDETAELALPEAWGKLTLSEKLAGIDVLRKRAEEAEEMIDYLRGANPEADVSHYTARIERGNAVLELINREND